MFSLVMSEDDLPTIMRGDDEIGRALTRRDGEAIVEVLNTLGAGLRDRVLSEVNDAIESCFDGVQ